MSGMGFAREEINRETLVLNSLYTYVASGYKVWYVRGFAPYCLCSRWTVLKESEHSVMLQLNHPFSSSLKSQDRRSVPGSLRHSDEEVCLLDEPSIVSFQLFGRVVELKVKPAHEFGDELGYLQQADVLAYAGP